MAIFSSHMVKKKLCKEQLKEKNDSFANPTYYF